MSRVYDLPFVLEDDMAINVLSYLKNRSLYSDRRVTVFAGMEGRDLQRGDIVTLHKPTRLLTGQTFKIDGIMKGGIGYELQCREYNASIYGTETITPPTGPAASDIIVEGPKTWVGNITLGDGIQQSGTVTLNLAPGHGDCYIAGGTINAAAWTANPGFLIGIDDSDGDKVKFYLGASGTNDYIYWYQGGALYISVSGANAIIVRNGADIQVQGGGDIILVGNDANPGRIYFYGTTRNAEVGGNTAGTSLFIRPLTDETIEFYLGTHGTPDHVFSGLNYYSTHRTEMVLYDNNNYIQWYSIPASGDVYDQLTLRRAGSSKSILFRYDASGNLWIYPTSHKEWDFGKNTNAYDDAWADDWHNVADFFFLDEKDDLAAILAIEPSKEIDLRTGLPIIDDKTLAEWILSKSKDGKEILRGPDGKPYISMKMGLSLVFGAVRQLKREINYMKSD